MEERPDIDNLKKKLKDENQSGNDGREKDDMLRARLEGEPEWESRKQTLPESKPSVNPDDSLHRPSSEENIPSAAKPAGGSSSEHAAGNYGGEDDEDTGEIETFTRDGKPISVDTFNSSRKTSGKEKRNGAGKDDSSVKKRAAEDKAKAKPKKERKPLKAYLKKPRRVHVYTSLVLLAILMFGVLVWYVFSSASAVKEISISGNSLISDDEIAERLQFAEGDKMFSIDTGRAEENISLLPAIEEVQVERSWWNGVDVNISEYRALGYVTNSGSYYPVLENARVLRGSPAAPKEAPILHYFEGEEFDALVSSLSKIEPSILDGISEIYYRPSEQSSTRIHMFMNDGQEIVADYRTIDSKMNYYIGMRNEIGDSTAGVIDLEIGSSFLPYDSAEAEDIKQGIYETPVQAQYIEDVSGSLGNVKEVLSGFGDGEE
ncbi:cell division protein FtsQ/DivIB [Salinicoccus halodurans]|uniref:Cell division protein FtsQ n=1 Tax=Salinicoccus halodurans TaxID=407035 RepID=A0A0F7D467_9STAP|nr:FtsQ-type POTRA domain-containing protein [Salinicoccus halodurans]AKG73705.1 hypothetical protein AAT16_05420 [Salinicoccus halodurans]SFK54577.1 cell division protein FtsQ [Salinicoccus halodurans]